ncbi:hypothetical protein [Plasmodium yoelii yoelii]|uniref:Uncharacterized protein n=1 Tax=Plasmodium yoelii yoelii TaxID=73239 RepID=Q7RDK3_PLAYO|nr:hypothetical protein [Plasmodium yoelii yoelii]
MCFFLLNYSLIKFVYNGFVSSEFRVVYWEHVFLVRVLYYGIYVLGIILY